VSIQDGFNLWVGKALADAYMAIAFILIAVAFYAALSVYVKVKLWWQSVVVQSQRRLLQSRLATPASRRGHTKHPGETP